MANIAQEYRVRVRIAGTDAAWSDVVADTHPHLTLDEPLDETLITRGLRNALALAADLIQQWHGRGDDIAGATRHALASRLGTVRVYLSVHRGRAGITIPYTLDNRHASEAYVLIEYGARLHMPHIVEERGERVRDAAAHGTHTLPATLRVLRPPSGDEPGR